MIELFFLNKVHDVGEAHPLTFVVFVKLKIYAQPNVTKSVQLYEQTRFHFYYSFS